MVAKIYTTGDIAAATGTSRRHVLNILAETEGEYIETKGGHRRFTDRQALKLIKAIKARRSPRYLDLI